MKKTISSQQLNTKFSRSSEMTLDGFMIVRGDLLKVRGEHGAKFKFDSLTTNTDSGSYWVDCFEISRGQIGPLRSFKADKIKRIPKKRVKK
jgi:hypothetical protein